MESLEITEITNPLQQNQDCHASSLEPKDLTKFRATLVFIPSSLKRQKFSLNPQAIPKNRRLPCLHSQFHNPTIPFHPTTTTTMTNQTTAEFYTAITSTAIATAPTKTTYSLRIPTTHYSPNPFPSPSSPPTYHSKKPTPTTTTQSNPNPNPNPKRITKPPTPSPSPKPTPTTQKRPPSKPSSTQRANPSIHQSPNNPLRAIKKTPGRKGQGLKPSL